MDQISPIEHAVLRLGTYELLHGLDVPWRVVINESIELAKAFGGTDGHKYVNGVLNALAPKLRAHEVAAQGEGAVSWKHSWRFFETNSMALARLAEELGKRDYLQRFIQIGTSELYGSVDHAAREDDPIRPSSPYAASKAAFDLHLMSVHRFLKFPMNIIRPSNAYCPAQLLHRVVPKAVVAGLTGRKLPLHGGGRAEKSYIHAKDLGRAIHLVAEKEIGRAHV